MLAWLLPPLLALFASAALCGLAVWAMPRLRFLDKPGSEAHKQQARAVPYGGGAGMALAVVLAVILCCWLPVTESVAVWWPVWAGAGVLALVGLADDIRPLKPGMKLAAQSLVCGLVILPADLPVDFLRHTSGFLAWGAAFAWLILITNAYNLLDHADGLSGSVSLVGCIALAGGSMLGGDLVAARNWFILAAAIGGFLVWNKPPARLYMGDAGALAIGFLIGCGTLSTTFWPSGESGSPLALLSPLLICSIPLFDTAVVVLKRLRRQQPIMRGDRNHISHRLTRLGVGPVASLGAVVALQVALAGATFQLRSADLLSGLAAVAQAAAICVALLLLETTRDHG